MQIYLGHVRGDFVADTFVRDLKQHWSTLFTWEKNVLPDVGRTRTMAVMEVWVEEVVWKRYTPECAEARCHILLSAVFR